MQIRLGCELGYEFPHADADDVMLNVPLCGREPWNSRII